MDEQKRKKRGKPKGRPKTGGRKKGVQNKKTILLRDILADVGFDFGTEFQLAFGEVEPDRRMSILLQLLPHIAPKLADKEVKDPESPVDENKSGDLDPSRQAELLKLIPKN